MIFYLASSFVFAVVSAIPSGRIDLVFPSVETSRSGVKTVKFRALDQDIELKLEPAGEILARNFVLVDEENQINHSIDVEDLKRRIYRDSAMGAALLIDEEGPLTIEGIINSKLRIAPHESGRTIKDGRIPHQIVEVINDKKSFVGDKIMSINVKKDAENAVRTAKQGNCTRIVIEYYCLLESTFTKSFKSVKALRDYITVLYTGVLNLLDTLNMGIKIRVLGVKLFSTKTDPPYIKQNVIPGHEEHFNCDNLILDMAKYYCKNATGLAKDADIIVLFVRRYLSELLADGTIEVVASGITPLGGICNQCSKVAVCSDDSDYNERVDIVAHETAHLLGSLHDGDKSPSIGKPGAETCPYTDGYIMGDRSNNVNKFKFSECSINTISSSLQTRKCLFEDC